MSAPLSIACDVTNEEQAEQLHLLRAAFQGRSDLEALNADTFVLHLWPGCDLCEGTGGGRTNRREEGPRGALPSP